MRDSLLLRRRSRVARGTSAAAILPSLIASRTGADHSLRFRRAFKARARKVGPKDGQREKSNSGTAGPPIRASPSIAVASTVEFPEGINLDSKVAPSFVSRATNGIALARRTGSAEVSITIPDASKRTVRPSDATRAGVLTKNLSREDLLRSIAVKIVSAMVRR